MTGEKTYKNPNDDKNKSDGGYGDFAAAMNNNYANSINTPTPVNPTPTPTYGGYGSTQQTVVPTGSDKVTVNTPGAANGGDVVPLGSGASVGDGNGGTVLPSGSAVIGNTTVTSGNGGALRGGSALVNKDGASLTEKTETPQVPTGESAVSGVPEVESGSTSVGGEVSGAEGAVITPTTESYNTAPLASYVPSITGAKKDYDTWFSEFGVDLDKEYEEGKAALEYDFMTSQANFGERAEQLAQMGLSGSGVSDIYNLAAFNSYVQAQNDLKYQMIEAKNQYKQQYNAYSEEYDQNLKTDTANAYNMGLEQYDGTNSGYVRQLLTSQGYDQQAVDSAISMLESLDVNTLPTVKARLEAEKKAAEEEKAKQDRLASLELLAHNAYNGKNQGEVETLLLNNSATADEVATIMAEITAEGYDLSTSTAYIQAQDKLKEDIRTATERAKQLWSGAVSATTKMGSSINVRKQLEAEGYSEEVINEAVKWIEEMSSADAVQWVKDKIEEAFSYIDMQNYDGSASTKAQIKRELKNAYSEYVIVRALDMADKQLNVVDENKNQTDAATVQDVVDQNDVASAIEMLASGNVSGSEKTQLQNVVNTALDNVFGENATIRSMKKSWAAFGYSEEEWKAMSDEDRLQTAMYTAADYYASGIIGEEQFKSYWKEYVKGNLDVQRNENVVDAVGNAVGAEGAFYGMETIESAAGLALQAEEMLDSTDLSEAAYNEMLVAIFDSLDESEQKGLYRNMYVYSENPNKYLKEAEKVAQWGTRYIEQAVANSGILGPFTSVITTAEELIAGNPQESGIMDLFYRMDDDQREALGKIYQAVDRDDKAHDRGLRNLFGLKSLYVDAVSN